MALPNLAQVEEGTSMQAAMQRECSGPVKQVLCCPGQRASQFAGRPRCQPLRGKGVRDNAGPFFDFVCTGLARHPYLVD